MSKNKSQQKLSPENYLRTRARSLPLGECYINENWKDSGMAFILVSRRHITGNLTMAVFQADLYCLGIKNAFWQFNEPPEIISESKARLEEQSGGDDHLIEVDYVLVHNIIFGAVAYAKELGFRPHKDFQLAQYVLEEDDERIELMDIEFGMEGRPAVFIGSESHPARIFQILDKSVGKGNYSVISEGEEFDDYNDTEENSETDINPDLEDDRFINKPIEEYNDQDFEDILKGNRIMKPCDLFLFTYSVAQANVEKRVKKELARIYKRIDNWSVSDDDHSEGQGFSTKEESDLYNNLYLEMEADPLQSIPSIKKAILAYPDSINLNNLLGIAYEKAEKPDELNKLAEDLFRKFPENVVVTNNYLNRLILSDRLEEAGLLIHPGFDLHQQFPHRKKFTPLEFFTFLIAMVNYHLSKNEILKAAAFANGLTLFEWFGEQKIIVDNFYLLVSNKLHSIFQPGKLEDLQNE
jgi:tetratricopeptide (TPR) repeat protein